jgi:hypothetical protein
MGKKKRWEEGMRPALPDLSCVSLQVERIEQSGKGLG